MPHSIKPSADGTELFQKINGNTNEAIQSSDFLENHGNILYVSTTGDNSTAEKGNPHRPYLTLDNARQVLAGDEFIHITIGDYVKSDQGTDQANQLALNGEKVYYKLEDGVRLSATNIQSPYGAGAGFNSYELSLPSEFSLIGESAVLEHDSVGILMAVSFSGDVKAVLKVKEIISTGASIPIRDQSQESYIEVDRIYHEERMCYSTASNTQASPVKKTFRCNYIHTNTGVDPGALRYQEVGSLANSEYYLEVGSMFLEGADSAAFYYQPQGASTGGNYSVSIGNIKNVGTGLPSQITGYPSGLGYANKSDIRLGSSDTGTTNNVISINVGTIDTTIVGLGFAYGSFISFRGSINIDSCKSTRPCIMFESFNMSSNSEITISGNYETIEDNQPVVLFTHTSEVDSTSILRFQNCVFRTRFAQPVVKIGSNYESDRVVFENCTFINDGTVAALETNAGAPISMIFKNCYTNSTVALVNITDTLSGLTQNVNII